MSITRKRVILVFLLGSAPKARVSKICPRGCTTSLAKSYKDVSIDSNESISMPLIQSPNEGIGHPFLTFASVGALLYLLASSVSVDVIFKVAINVLSPVLVGAGNPSIAMSTHVSSLDRAGKFLHCLSFCRADYPSSLVEQISKPSDGHPADNQQVIESLKTWADWARNGGNEMGENFENSNFQEQSLGDYVLRSKLGESSLSTVWRAEHRTTGEVVALKQIPLAKLTRHLRNCLDCELTFLSSVNHPNIIRLLDFFEYEGSIILALEFCAGGNLASYIQHHGRVQECVAKRFMQQLGAGLKVLKQNHIVHRDLKPENILLSCSDCNPILKIADFGLSRILLPDESAETVCGSPLYMAPEILQFQRYDEKVCNGFTS
ncbi:UNVERIFIED_CONTAM: Serine/threonine-protein kinase ATG1t [Sesamum indicum]